MGAPDPRIATTRKRKFNIAEARKNGGHLLGGGGRQGRGRLSGLLVATQHSDPPASRMAEMDEPPGWKMQVRACDANGGQSHTGN
jgi:hypothetical protein